MNEEQRIGFERKQCEHLIREGEDICPGTLRHISAGKFECTGPERHLWQEAGRRDGVPVLHPEYGPDLPPA
jgi:hypothetical protein